MGAICMGAPKVHQTNDFISLPPASPRQEPCNDPQSPCVGAATQGLLSDECMTPLQPRASRLRFDTHDPNSSTDHCPKAATVPVPLKEFPEGDAANAWKLERLIGHGSFGEVFLACTEDGDRAAVKVLSFETEEANFQRRLQLLERELQILRGLPCHPNVIRFITARSRGSHAFIFMEYCDSGTLRDLYASRRSGLAYLEAQMCTLSIVQGLWHLHKHLIAHRDLKCENVFLCGNGEVKLGDFGASIVMDDALRSSFIGSIYWMAPEVVRREGHRWQADIWSLGCTVLEMLTGALPFSQHSSIKSVVSFLASDDPVLFDTTNIPPPACTFILRCLKRNPEDRPACDQLVEHRFLLSELESPRFKLSFGDTLGLGRLPSWSAGNLDPLCRTIERSPDPM